MRRASLIDRPGRSPGRAVLGGSSSSKLARSIGNASDVLAPRGPLLEDEALEVRERLGDGEAARGRLQVAAEEVERDLVAACAASSVSAASVASSRSRWCSISSWRAGDRDPRSARRGRAARGAARARSCARATSRKSPSGSGRLSGHSPTVGEIRPSRWSAETSTPSFSRQSWPSAWPGAATSSQPSRLVALAHEHRVGLVADEGRVDRARLDQLLGVRPRHAVREEPVRDPLRPLRRCPRRAALRVVELALVDGRARQRGHVGGRADVVGVEVRDEDARDAPGRRPARPPSAPRRPGRPMPGVDERPAVVARAGGRRARGPGRVGSGHVMRRIPPGSSLHRAI